MTTQPKHAFPSVVDNANHHIKEVISDLKIRKERGDKDIIDTYEYGFISALKMLDKVYNLKIDFGDEEDE